MRKYGITIMLPWLALFTGRAVQAQYAGFSISPDIGLLRSFRPQQQFSAIGSTIQVQFHLAPKDGAYAWFSYYQPRKLSNELLATAKSSSTSPYEIPFRNTSELRFRQISLGWRHYLKGAANNENSWNLYASAGFGLLFGKAINTRSVAIDTSQYTVPVLEGRSGFKRLTFDLGLGGEYDLGGSLFLFLDVKSWIPASNYPSPYLVVNTNAPLTGMVNIGIRVYFD